MSWTVDPDNEVSFATQERFGKRGEELIKDDELVNVQSLCKLPAGEAENFALAFCDTAAELRHKMELRMARAERNPLKLPDPLPQPNLRVFPGSRKRAMTGQEAAEAAEVIAAANRRREGRNANLEVREGNEVIARMAEAIRQQHLEPSTEPSSACLSSPSFIIPASSPPVIVQSSPSQASWEGSLYPYFPPVEELLQRRLPKDMGESGKESGEESGEEPGEEPEDESHDESQAAKPDQTIVLAPSRLTRACKHIAKGDEYSQEQREARARSASRGFGRGRGGRGRGQSKATVAAAKEMSQLLDNFVPDSSNRLA